MESKYETATLKVMDRISAYFVYTVYNSLYKTAKSAHERGQFPTVTEAYRTKLSQISSGVATVNNLYKQFANSFHIFYQERVEPGITFDKFTVALLNQFIPSDYFKDLTGPQRDKTLQKIITNAFVEFIKIIKTKWIGPIIDDHKNALNMESIKKVAVDVLLAIRNAYWAKFATGVNDAKGVGVPFSVFEEAKSLLVKTQDELIQTRNERDRALFIIRQMMEKMNEMQTELISSRTHTKQIPYEPEDFSIMNSAVEVDPVIDSAYASAPKIILTRPESDSESEE